jgi:hypothetical protein
MSTVIGSEERDAETACARKVAPAPEAPAFREPSMTRARADQYDGMAAGFEFEVALGKNRREEECRCRSLHPEKRAKFE